MIHFTKELEKFYFKLIKKEREMSTSTQPTFTKTIKEALEAKEKLEEKIRKANPFKEEESPKRSDVDHYQNLIKGWTKIDDEETTNLKK